MKEKEDSRGEKSPSPLASWPHLCVQTSTMGFSFPLPHSLLPSNTHVQTTSACGGGKVEEWSCTDELESELRIDSLVLLSWEVGQWPPPGESHLPQRKWSLGSKAHPPSLCTLTPALWRQTQPGLLGKSGVGGGSSLHGRGIYWTPLLHLPFGHRLGGHIGTALRHPHALSLRLVSFHFGSSTV